MSRSSSMKSLLYNPFVGLRSNVDTLDLILASLFSCLIITFQGGGITIANLIVSFLCFPSTFLYIPGPVMKALDCGFLAPKFSRTNKSGC